MLLATDLDGTFLGGSEESRTELYELLRQWNNLCLVFVTGRGLQTVLPLLSLPGMPRPQYIISDVGATVVHGHHLQPVQPLQQQIAERWPGREKVLQQMQEVKGLRPQEVPQERRCSFFYDGGTDVEAARAAAALLGCDVLLSAGKYLDVLPGGVNKGSTLQQLLALLAYPAKDVLVAGDTMNDRSLYDTGLKGVVVGQAEPALLEYTRNHAQVLQAQQPGAGGILEAIRHFGL